MQNDTEQAELDRPEPDDASPLSLDGAVVLQVLPALETGGVERGTVEMVRAIRDAGGVPVVASAGGRLVSLVTRHGGEHVTLPLQGKSPLAIWGNAARLARVIRRFGVDIVHARSRAPAWSAWLAARRTGARFMTTYHGVYSENAPLKRRYNSIMARGERVIAISSHVAEHVLERHPIDPARLRVIPRGVDVAAFDPSIITGPRIARLAERWHLPMDGRVVMLPGRLTAWKGHAVLLDALARSRHPDLVAVLVGPDQGRVDYVKQLLRQAEQLGVRDRIRLTGQCDDMPAAMMLADVVVVPSIQPEAFGRSVIEAQAMARPVIAAGHGGATETVVPRVTGWLVPPGDADALRDMLDAVLDLSDEDRQMIGRQARDAVRAGFGIKVMQAATLAVYQDLLREPDPGKGIPVHPR